MLKLTRPERHIKREEIASTKLDNFLEIENFLTLLGLPTHAYREGTETLAGEKLPLIAHIRLTSQQGSMDHFTVVVAYDQKRGFKLVDPLFSSDRPTWVSAEDFKSAFCGEAILISPAFRD